MNDMKVIKTNVYQFNELDDKAKEKARNWYRESAMDHEWWDFTYEDAALIGLKITSFDLDRNRHAKGKLIEHPEAVAKKILKEHGDKTDTYKLADAFLVAYRHAVKMNDDDSKQEELAEEFERDLIEEYSMMLQRESDYLVSSEAVDESIIANEYTFTKDGKRFG